MAGFVARPTGKALTFSRPNNICSAQESRIVTLRSRGGHKKSSRCISTSKVNYDRKKRALKRMPDTSIMYALQTEVKMAAKAKLKRKSYFVDERALSRAKKALGVKTEAEVIRLSVERVAEMEEFWEFMKKTRRTLRPGSVEKS
jgi:hypothetical protein